MGRQVLENVALVKIPEESVPLWIKIQTASGLPPFLLVWDMAVRPGSTAASGR